MSDLDLNDTLEEQLRHMLVDKNNECNSLKAHIKMLEEAVAQEQEAKYRAYVKIADLTQKINKGILDLKNLVHLGTLLKMVIQLS
jgi:hypothetical protein